MSYIFTPLATDNFHQTDGPVNPANWTVLTGLNTLQTLLNVCVAPSPAGTGGDLYTGVVFPDDQYVSVTLLADLSEVDIEVRTDVTFAAGYAGVADYLSPGIVTVQLISLAGGVLGTVPSQAFAPGDIMTLGAIGTTIFILWNGAQILSATDSSAASGAPAMGMSYAVTQADTSVSLFEAGSVAQSLLAAAVTTFSGIQQLAGPLNQLNQL